MAGEWYVGRDTGQRKRMEGRVQKREACSGGYEGVEEYS